MANPICPPDCNSPLPIVSFTDCNPPIHLSEIEWLLFAKPGAAVIATGDLADWQARINNQGNGIDAIRMIRGTGNMPAATDNEAVVSGQRRLVIDRSFSIDIDIDELSDTNYNAFRELQCGGTLKIWFVTRSGHIFGGSDGILATVKGNIILDRGENAFQRIAVNVSWKSKFMPERAMWPLYNNTQSEQQSYDSTLTFASGTTDSEDGVSGEVGATDADLKFEFNGISPRVGAAQSMDIRVGGVSQIVVDYTADYNGRAWRFTSAGNVQYTGTFINGNVDF